MASEHLAETSGPQTERKVYCLFDANVIAAYYLPQAHRDPKVSKHATTIIESVRSGAAKHFFYIPNFCIAEVFGVFAKHAYGDWNPHIKQGKHGTIDGRVYKSLSKQFQADIHNAALFYHYELTRYHVLATGMVAPIDHYYKLSRSSRQATVPAGTFDQLVVAMGIHLTKIHGQGNVVIVTADRRLARVVDKCRSHVPNTARKKLHLDWIAKFVGIPFVPASFPMVLNLQKARDKDFKATFGEWPLPVKNRYKKPYHLNQKRKGKKFGDG